MSRPFWRRLAPPVLLSLAVLSGCDSTPPGRVRVRPAGGIVLFRGKPLAGANVVFQPADPGGYGKDVPRPTARTGADGRFSLMTYGAADGAPAGSYRVSVATPAGPSGEDRVRLVGKAGGLGPGGPLDVLNGRYADPDKSGLKADVGPDGGEIPPFDLK